MNMKENYLQKIKCKENYNSQGERIILSDYDQACETMPYYQWKKEILKVIDKNKLNCYFNVPDNFEDDTKPYLDPNVLRRVQRHHENPNRYDLDRHDLQQFENYKKEKRNWENNCAESINLIIDCVCSKIRIKIEMIEGYNEKSRENIRRLMKYLERSYGGFTADRDQQINDNISKFKQIQSINELDNFIQLINEHQMEKQSKLKEIL